MKTKTEGNKALFEQVLNIVSEEFEIKEKYNPKKRLPKIVDAFKAVVCLSILAGLNCSEISRLSGRSKGIYKTRNNGYLLQKTNPDFKEKYDRAKNKVLKLI